MLPSLLPVLSLVAVLPAALSTPSVLNRNLAFRSPYTNEPHLGIDIAALHERHTAAKRSLDAELGALRRGGKRQAQEVRPAGKPHGYTYAGYGLGVASWDDASYVHAGELNYTHSVASGESGALDEWLSAPRGRVVSRYPFLYGIRPSSPHSLNRCTNTNVAERRNHMDAAHVSIP